MELEIGNSGKWLQGVDLQKYIKEFIPRLKELQKITEEIIQTEDYINWLKTFMTRKINSQCFSDNDWLYHPEKISQEDKDKVSKLGNFYEAIQIYADKNYIYGTPDEWGNHYNIKHNNVGYYIGIMTGQGNIFWVRSQRLTKENSDDFIDFKLIQEGKITDRAEVIGKKLLDLELFINNMVSEGVPVEAIARQLKKY